MSAQPAWESVDDTTADVLSLVADRHHVSAAFEWAAFVHAVHRVADRHHGRVDQNVMRPLLRGVVGPKRTGAFYRRACLEGLLRPTGEWSVSDDTEGRNAGRPIRVYELGGAL